jgi:hypothetical protein
MKRLVLVAMTLLLTYGDAAATSPCCAAKPCPPGKYAKKNSSPGTAQCCSRDAQDVETCTGSPNAGYACDNAADDPATFASNKPGTGCAEVTDDTCVGGDAQLPAGCIWVGGTGTTTVRGGDCNALAVAACCDAGSCR